MKITVTQARKYAEMVYGIGYSGPQAVRVLGLGTGDPYQDEALAGQFSKSVKVVNFREALEAGEHEVPEATIRECRQWELKGDVEDAYQKFVKDCCQFVRDHSMSAHRGQELAQHLRIGEVVVKHHEELSPGAKGGDSLMVALFDKLAQRVG